MDEARIMQTMEDALVDSLKKGDFIKIPYDTQIDITDLVRKSYTLVDVDAVMTRVKQLLEESIAEKLVSKMLTEMGTDIKKIMGVETVREDFRFFMRQGVEKVMEKMKDENKA